MKIEPKSISYDGLVCDLLFQQVTKPKNMITCKAVNVFDNRYRINVYAKTIIDDNGLEGQKIAYSCFARLDDNKFLRIIDPAPTGNMAL
jgi:hypothetical protein